MENVRNHRDIKLVINNEKRKKIVSEPDYIKPKYQEKAQLCHMDTDSFIIHIKTEYFYKDIANDVKKTV